MSPLIVFSRAVCMGSLEPEKPTQRTEFLPVTSGKEEVCSTGPWHSLLWGLVSVVKQNIPGRPWSSRVGEQAGGERGHGAGVRWGNKRRCLWSTVTLAEAQQGQGGHELTIP
jgi:hypothetical protein